MAGIMIGDEDGLGPHGIEWACRTLLGRPTAEDVSELLRRGFPLHAGLRGEALKAYRKRRKIERLEQALVRAIDGAGA